MPTVGGNRLPFPPSLLAILARLAAQHGSRLYVAGGTVRDWLLKRSCNDLDLTVATGAVDMARRLADAARGTFVMLDPAQDVARVVWQGVSIDFAAFREQTTSIEDDLRKRDFTINALAVPLNLDHPDSLRTDDLIDPTSGVSDLHDRIIRSTDAAVFDNDPLRLLRAYRFMATLGFALHRDTAGQIRSQGYRLERVAPERLAYELALLMTSDNASAAVAQMATSGLLWQVFPELRQGVGVAQPASHHLDVFDHSLAALVAMETIQAEPGRYFPGCGGPLRDYLAESRRGVRLKWAALFHDLGKPATSQVRADKQGRITFYNHDRAGARLFETIAVRLRWSREETQAVSRLVALHMWPFHLSNASRKTGLTPRACLRLVKAIGADLPGLFMLTMADCLSGQGKERPRDMEQRISDLFAAVTSVYQLHIKPVLEQPRVLTGADLVEVFGLTPGPIFSRILDGLEKAMVAGEVRNRTEAVEWVRHFLQQQVEVDAASTATRQP